MQIQSFARNLLNDRQEMKVFCWRTLQILISVSDYEHCLMSTASAVAYTLLGSPFKSQAYNTLFSLNSL